MFTAASVGNAAATSGSRSTRFEPERSRLTYLPRTPPFIDAKSCSGSMPFEARLRTFVIDNTESGPSRRDAQQAAAPPDIARQTQNHFYPQDQSYKTKLAHEARDCRSSVTLDRVGPQSVAQEPPPRTRPDEVSADHEPLRYGPLKSAHSEDARAIGKRMAMPTRARSQNETSGLSKMLKCF